MVGGVEEHGGLDCPLHPLDVGLGSGKSVLQQQLKYGSRSGRRRRGPRQSEATARGCDSGTSEGETSVASPSALAVD